MNIGIIAVLAVFWVALSYRAFQRGDAHMAGIYILVGVALTVFRLGKMRG